MQQIKYLSNNILYENPFDGICKKIIIKNVADKIPGIMTELNGIMIINAANARCLLSFIYCMKANSNRTEMTKNFG
jgi:hypothetical protein